ncbi:MAG: hypothetical protein K6T83_04650 [Alicyclobacillus sp.]|nr:hypothetical protein [Alicyclobacillus sp.]
MFDWESYLELAKVLDKRDDEASKRSAISRSYYAAFCAARNWIRKNYPECNIPDTGEAHKVVWDMFRNSPDQHKKSIGEHGSALRRKRRNADYDDLMPTPEKYSKEAILRTMGIISALKEISSSVEKKD